METTQKKSTKIVGIKNAGLVIICCFIIAVCIYHFILGNPTNFMLNANTVSNNVWITGTITPPL